MHASHLANIQQACQVSERIYLDSRDLQPPTWSAGLKSFSCSLQHTCSLQQSALSGPSFFPLPPAGPMLRLPVLQTSGTNLNRTRTVPAQDIALEGPQLDKLKTQTPYPVQLTQRLRCLGRTRPSAAKNFFDQHRLLLPAGSVQQTHAKAVHSSRTKVKLLPGYLQTVETTSGAQQSPRASLNLSRNQRSIGSAQSMAVYESCAQEPSESTCRKSLGSASET